jgi:superfamily II DNA/RNA helicase
MMSFAQWELPAALIASLTRMGITVPTPIQQETIPLALEGFDILASAQTGTGKTIAYLIPLIQKMTKNPQGPALILTPTRELAMQVHQALNQMAGQGFKATLLIGGASMSRQLAELKKKPRVIVGTPGRINDHLERRSLHLNETRFLVIDEADRMLDMGFGVQLDRIAKHLPAQRQTLFFSATFLPNIVRLSERFLKDPKRVTINTNNQPAPKIQQEVIHISNSEKKTQLIKHLNQREGSIIIFVKTRRKAESMSKELKQAGHNADAIHGNLRQNRREQVIRAFRSSKSRILVATDVASRGLDIPHVMHVINYDLPECPEDYVHRIGRTGRAGAEGFALSLISPEDNFRWKAIERLLNPRVSAAAPRNAAPKNEKSHRPQKKWHSKKFKHKANHKPHRDFRAAKAKW